MNFDILITYPSVPSHYSTLRSKTLPGSGQKVLRSHSRQRRGLLSQRRQCLSLSSPPFVVPRYVHLFSLYSARLAVRAASLPCLRMISGPFHRMYTALNLLLYKLFYHNGDSSGQPEEGHVFGQNSYSGV
ncbi:hypothetical protein AA313_de0209616 [Arthrobotrys entomopaga]|nr:hypothetical protein AA313_de0209616 [Arthrobotrys entomopaga]